MEIKFQPANKYVVETGSSNPRILQYNEDGTYTVLTHGAGDKSISDLVTLCTLANNVLIERLAPRD